MAATLVISVTWFEDGRTLKFQFDANEHPTFSTLLGVVGPTMLSLKGYDGIFTDMTRRLDSLPVREFQAVNWTQAQIRENIDAFKEQVKVIILNIDFRLSKIREDDPEYTSLRLMQDDLRRILQ